MSAQSNCLFSKGVIGKNIKVVESGNPALLKIKGEVIDETKNMLFVKTTKGMKKVIKKGSVFMINGVKVRGSNLKGRPEERIRKSK